MQITTTEHTTHHDIEHAFGQSTMGFFGQQFNHIDQEIHKTHQKMGKNPTCGSVALCKHLENEKKKLKEKAQIALYFENMFSNEK